MSEAQKDHLAQGAAHDHLQEHLERYCARLSEWSRQEHTPSHELISPDFLETLQHSQGKPCTLLQQPHARQKAQALALLQLPSMRSYWTRQLRTSTYSALIAALPPHYFLRPEALPPQGAIPKLSHQSWKSALAGTPPPGWHILHDAQGQYPVLTRQD